MRWGVLVIAALGGCVSSGVSTCPGSDAFCPDGSVCREITLWTPEGAAPATEFRCVLSADIAECSELEDGEACTAVGGAGRCHSGACFASECGNHLIDPGEVCDDADAELGDGCSPDCRSDETCGNGIVDPVKVVGMESLSNEQCDDGDRRSHDGCSADCVLETPRWREISFRDVEERGGARMVFDTRRGRLVAFGGDVGTAHDDDDKDQTLVGGLFDCFAAVSPICLGLRVLDVGIRPARRHDHMMAYDARRDRVVMYGGATRASFLDDLWEWDGQRWTQINAPDGPGLLRLGGMVYDPVHFTTVLFGGDTPSLSPAPKRQPFLWDGVAWRRGADAPDSTPTVGHAMAYDPRRGVIVVIGPVGGETTVHTYDVGADRWDAVAVTGVRPPPRANAAMAFDSVTGKMLYFGGEDTDASGFFQDAWLWDADAAVFTPVAQFPQELIGMAVATDPTRQRVIAYGGHITDNLAIESARIWDGASWSPALRPRNPKLPFVAHEAAYDPIRDRTVLLRNTETFELAAIETHLDTNLGNPPGVKSSAIAFDLANREAVLFGGLSTVVPIPPAPPMPFLGATWVWNGSGWVERIVAGPPARANHAMAYDADAGRIVLFGGTNTNDQPTSDTWEWRDGAWNELTASAIGPDGPPPPRAEHAMAYDPIHRQIVMFGGAGDAPPGPRADTTWIFAGGIWSKGPALGPVPRFKPALAWSNARRRVILFGGRAGTNSDLADTWEWDGESRQWLEVTVDLVPPGRNQHTLTTSANGVLLIGGVSVSSPGTNGLDHWELQWESGVADDLCRDLRDHPDRDGLLGCADPDCRGVCTPLCVSQATEDDGDPETPLESVCVTGPSCGDGICDPLENCRLCGDCTCTPVCGDGYCEAPETIASCKGDCTHVCGDGTCDLDETTASCAADCPS